MISIQQALNLYLEKLSPLASERIPVESALHRVLADDVLSHSDLPRFDQSAMDGYVLRASDTNNAPSRLPVAGLSAAGNWPEQALETGTAWRIYTGAAIPAGADTVIPQERVTRDNDDLVLDAAYPAGKNIRYRGEEIPAGSQLGHAGQRLSPGLIASLCNGGISEVSVTCRPRISILVTGDEVRPVGCELKPGDIPDSNGPYIQNWLLANGYAAPDIRYVSDSKSTVLECLTKAANDADLIITTGGASVGDRDFIPSTARELGFNEIFWKVAQKPGKPIFFGLREQQALLGLPGNPGAVLVGMELHVRSLLNQLEGAAPALPDWSTGTLLASVQADSHRDRLVRMQQGCDDEGRITLQPLGMQDSHMLSNLGQADVLVWLPSRTGEYRAGDKARFLILS